MNSVNSASSRARVLVIGGGIGGVSIGYELADDHDVILLEGESALGSHSTGRSAALFVSWYGPPVVQALTRVSTGLFERIEADCEAPHLRTSRGAVLTAWDSETASQLHDLTGAGRTGIEPLSAAEARKLCPVLRTDLLAGAAYDATVQDLDVMGLHQIYLAGLRRRGGQVHTDARVRGLERTGQGWIVRTDERDWDVDVVINAAGAWGDEITRLAGLAPMGLQPLRRTIVISPRGDAVDPGWPVVADAAEAWYFKPEGDGLLLSPCDETLVAPGDVRPEPLDVALALDRVNSATTLSLRSVRTSWAGLRTFSADRCPIVGAHPSDASFFMFLAQGGYGIQIAPALARLAAEAFRDAVTSGQHAEFLTAMSPARFDLAGITSSTGGE